MPDTLSDERLSRILSLEIVRVTERAAVAAARVRGRGDEKEADRMAVDAMRAELNNLRIRGRVVIGEGERDEAPMLYIGEEVGIGEGPEVDIALDPLEGTTLAAKNQANALAVIAVARRDSLLYAPDVYMRKIAIGPGYPDGTIALDDSPRANIRRVAEAKGVPVEQVTACVMDRERHEDLIRELREVGCAIRLIGDGDVAAIIHATNPDATGIDIYIGTGGAPEGVLAAAALRCTGGQMQARLILDTDEKRARAKRMGVDDPDRLYDLRDLASGDCIFAATGVTDGSMLGGVKFNRNDIVTETIVMRSSSGTVREIRSRHQNLDKFSA